MLLGCVVLGSAASESGCWGPKKGGQSSPNPASVSVPTPPKADLYGVVKAVDPARRTITLSVEKDDEKVEKSYEVAKDATILLEEPCSLADLAVGNRVALLFDADRKSVIEVRAEPFRIFVKPKTKQIEVNKQFDVELRVVNASALPQSFRAMSCSWFTQWQSGNPRVSPGFWGCKGNLPLAVKLAPGEAYEKVLWMKATATGFLSFRMGFTPLKFDTGDGPRKQSSKRTYWSNEATIQVNQG